MATRFYGLAVTGMTATIRPGGNNFVHSISLSTLYSALLPYIQEKDPSYLYCQNARTGVGYASLVLVYADETRVVLAVDETYAYIESNYGINCGPASISLRDYIDLSITRGAKRAIKLYGSLNGQTKTIKKMYGSVNGLTKLIYQE